MGGRGAPPKVPLGPPPPPEREALVAALVAAAHAPEKSEILCRPRPPGIGASGVRVGLTQMMGDTHLKDMMKEEEKKLVEDAASQVSTLVKEKREEWLPVNLRRKEGVGSAKARPFYIEMLRDLPWEQIAGREPDLVLDRQATKEQASTFDNRTGGKDTIWGYHGAPFEMVWSLLGVGFVNAALIEQSLGGTGQLPPGTSQPTGVKGQPRERFGQGIYLSQDPEIAYTETTMSNSLPYKMGRWRCLMVAEVCQGPLVTIGNAGASACKPCDDDDDDPKPVAPRMSSINPADVPADYIIVEDSDAVTIRCACLWREPGEYPQESFLSKYGPEVLAGVVVVVGGVLWKIYSDLPEHMKYF